MLVIGGSRTKQLYAIGGKGRRVAMIVAAGLSRTAFLAGSVEAVGLRKSKPPALKGAPAKGEEQELR